MIRRVIYLCLVIFKTICHTPSPKRVPVLEIRLAQIHTMCIKSNNTVVHYLKKRRDHIGLLAPDLGRNLKKIYILICISRVLSLSIGNKVRSNFDSLVFLTLFYGFHCLIFPLLYRSFSIYSTNLILYSTGVVFISHSNFISQHSFPIYIGMYVCSSVLNRIRHFLFEF